MAKPETAYIVAPKELIARARFMDASNDCQRAVALLHWMVDCRGLFAAAARPLQVALFCPTLDVLAWIDEAISARMVEVYEEDGDIVGYLVDYEKCLTERMQAGRKSSLPDRTSNSRTITSLRQHYGITPAALPPQSVATPAAEVQHSPTAPCELTQHSSSTSAALTLHSPSTGAALPLPNARARADAAELSLAEHSSALRADARAHARVLDEPESQDSPEASQGDPLGSREQPKAESDRETPRIPAYQKRHEPPRGMSGMPRSQTAHFDRFADHFGDPLPPLPPPKPEPTDEELMALWHSKRAAYEAEKERLAREQGHDDEAAAPLQEAP